MFQEGMEKTVGRNVARKKPPIPVSAEKKEYGHLYCALGLLMADREASVGEELDLPRIGALLHGRGRQERQRSTHDRRGAFPGLFSLKLLLVYVFAYLSQCYY